jgi:cell division protein ZapA
MAQISLTINDRSYDVTCDDGQEGHLRKLAEHLDDRVRELAGAVGQVGEGRLLVMASLVVADELFEAYKQIHALKAGAEPEAGTTAETLEACAQRIEAIAARLGGA